jgi:hypothetical protein
MTIITPYRISVTDAVLADLKARRRNTSWRKAECLRDSQARVDQEFFARRSAAVGRDDVGIERL